MTEQEGPWYKQFWLWFILAPLAILIAATFYLLYLAITTSDGVILDNYYRDGKGYVLRTEEDEFARSAQLRAELHLADDRVQVKLTGHLVPMPDQLRLIIAHPTSQAYDVSVDLTHRGLGEFTAPLSAQFSGRRILQLQPVNSEQDWRLHFDGELNNPTADIKLLPRQQ